MIGVRKVAKRKAPKPRPGLDDRAHLARVRQLPCLLKGRRGVVKKWVGTYPHVEQVEVEVQHICSGKSDAHHTVTKARRGSDLSTVPLCRLAHEMVHRIGQAEVELIFDVDLRAEAKRLAER